MRLALIPLDERPVNTAFPQQAGLVAGCEVMLPPHHMLPNKHDPGAYEGLGPWLEEVASEADGLVVSAETLAFGGLIPSRTTRTPLDEGKARLEALRRIKARWPKLPIYAFTLVMRIPAYNSADEEPYYWAHYGQKIHQVSQLIDKVERLGNPADREALAALEKEIPAEVLADWRWRRARNHSLNQEMVRLAAEGIVDFLLITQDDSSEFAVSAAEQRILRRLVADYGVEEKAVMYPGADEVGLLLVARHVNRVLGFTPRVFPRYSSIKGPLLIPRYEDRPQAESLKGQVYALGGILVDSPVDADLMLFLNTPGEAQGEAPKQDTCTTVDTAGRNLLDFVEAMRYYAGRGKAIAVADVAYSNGADLRLIPLLARRVGLERLAAYAGWNTSGNTLGTVLAHASILGAAERRSDAGIVAPELARIHMTFLLSRFIEDWGYQAIARTKLQREILPQKGISPGELGDRWPEVQELAAIELQAVAEQAFKYIKDKPLYWQGQALSKKLTSFSLSDVYLPWRRLFEIGFNVDVKVE